MKVGIIGAGTMGSGIAQAFAQTEGYEVCLCDINNEFEANGKNKKSDKRMTEKRAGKTAAKGRSTAGCRMTGEKGSVFASFSPEEGLETKCVPSLQHQGEDEARSKAPSGRELPAKPGEGARGA